MQERNYSKEEEKLIVDVFDSYIKKVIRNNVNMTVSRQLHRYEHECMVELTEIEYILNYAPIDDTIEVMVANHKFLIRDERLLEALMKLSEIERNVVLLNIYGEFNLGEVAEELEVKYSTVRSIKIRGIRKLKEELLANGLRKV